MPGYFSDHAAHAILDHYFGGTPIRKPPAILYVGLSLRRANRSGLVSEPIGVGYSRVPVPNSPHNWHAASSGVKANVWPIAFGFGPVEDDWGDVIAVFVADQPRSGKVIALADLAHPVLVRAGAKAPWIPAETLTLRFG